MFNEYPYVNLQDINLDWIIKKVNELSTNLENFVNINTIKYADPIIWNITEQYEMNTVVVDGLDGTAYISVRPVPSGVNINNTDYWTPIFNYGASIADLKSNIASNEQANTTATKNYAADSLVWFNGDTYKTSRAIEIGDAFLVGYNIDKMTVEEYINYISSRDNESLSDTFDDKLDELSQAVDDKISDFSKETILTYDTVSSFIDDTDRTEGNVVLCKNYRADDGHKTYFKVVTDEPAFYHLTLSNGLYAVILNDGYITPEMFGAYGNGTNDDTLFIQEALDYPVFEVHFDNDYLVQTNREIGTLTDGTDPTKHALLVSIPKKLVFNGTVKGYHTEPDNTYGCYFMEVNSPIIIDGLDYDGQRPTYAYQYGIQFNASNIVISNCSVKNLGSSGYIFNGNYDTRIEHIDINNVKCHNTGNSLFFVWCNFINVDGVTLTTVSEGFDFDKECKHVNINNVNCNTYRGGGADACIEINGGKFFNIVNVNCSDFVDGILINGKDYVIDGNTVRMKAENINVSNCNFYNITGHGVWLGNAIAGLIDEEKFVNLTNVTVRGSTLSGFEIRGEFITLTNCSCLYSSDRSITITTKAKDISIDTFYSKSIKGFINCDTTTGELNISVVKDDESQNTSGINNITGVDRLHINGLTISGESNYNVSNNKLYQISATSADISGLTSNRLATALINITTATKANIYNSAYRTSALDFITPSVFCTNTAYSDLSISSINIRRGDLLICTPSANNVEMYVCKRSLVDDNLSNQFFKVTLTTV